MCRGGRAQNAAAPDLGGALGDMSRVPWVLRGVLHPCRALRGAQGGCQSVATARVWSMGADAWRWFISSRPLPCPAGAAPCPAVPKVPAALGMSPGSRKTRFLPMCVTAAGRDTSPVPAFRSAAGAEGWFQAASPLVSPSVVNSPCHQRLPTPQILPGGAGRVSWGAQPHTMACMQQAEESGSTGHGSGAYGRGTRDGQGLGRGCEGVGGQAGSLCACVHISARRGSRGSQGSARGSVGSSCAGSQAHSSHPYRLLLAKGTDTSSIACPVADEQCHHRALGGRVTLASSGTCLDIPRHTVACTSLSTWPWKEHAAHPGSSAAGIQGAAILVVPRNARANLGPDLPRSHGPWPTLATGLGHG